MGNEIERVPLTDLEKRAVELRGDERFMTANDQLVHIEVQGIATEQHQQALQLAKMQLTVNRLVNLTDALVLDREQLVAHVRSLQAECEQMHEHQIATDARLEVLHAVFEAGLTEIRSVVATAEDTAKQILIKSEDETTKP